MTDELVPTTWQMVPLGRLFARQRREPGSDDGVVTAFRDGQVTLRSKRRTDGFTEAIKEIGYQGVRRGDLVIHAMDGFAGAIGVSEADGKSSPVYSVLTPEVDVEPRFYAYVLRNYAVSGAIQSLSQGIRERSTDFRWSTAKAVSVPFPTLEVQRRIADYLDHETREIDSLLKSLIRLRTLVRERFSADRTSTFVDAGSRYGTVPLKRTLAEPLRYGANLAADQNVEGDIRYLRITDFNADGTLRAETKRTLPKEQVQNYMVHPGDTLIARSGATVGKSFLVPEELEAACFAGYLICARPGDGINPKYLWHALQTETFRSWVEETATVATIPNISAEEYGEYPVPVPPGEVQFEIASRLFRADQTLLELEYLITDAIELARERRSALISAAVTGKLDVTSREAVA